MQFRLALLLVSTSAGSLAPKLGDGKDVDWFFAYKLNSDAYPGCSDDRTCTFGGEVQTKGGYAYGWGMQYLLASSVGGKTESMTLHSNCIGEGADPVAQTFEQIYSGQAENYVIWNDQLYLEPLVKLDPPCSTYSSQPTSCSAPWGHSKGMLAWDSAGNGFVMQVTTPSWPGSGNSAYPRPEQGNTLGCIKDNDVEAAQHFFALRLTPADVKSVLQAMRTAMVVTDPTLPQLVKLSNSPSELQTLAEGLGKADDTMDPFQATLSSGVQLIAKPHALAVPPWLLVSSLLQVGLRTGTWWASPYVNSTHPGPPGCWGSGLADPLEVQVATSGQWDGTSMSMQGTFTGNHAKIGHSLGGSLSVLADMNMMGHYSPSEGSCASSQNGRGGLFFVLDDATLHSGLQSLLTGETAAYEPQPGVVMTLV